MNTKTIGYACRKWRKENGITLKYMAELSGYTAPNIHKFEIGGNNNAVILMSYFKKGFTLIDYNDYEKEVSIDG